MTDVGTLPGGRRSELVAINASGVAVGEADDEGGRSHAVVYRDGTLTDLETLLETGWTLRDAAGIDDDGHIAANAILPGAPGEPGRVHAVLLVPR